MKHTRGSWHVVGKSEIRAESGLLLAKMHDHLEANQVPQDANVKLMAAAPDLLQALTDINNRASGLNQSDEFTFEKYYWESVKIYQDALRKLI